MRSIPLMAATTVILAAAWACGGDGGGGTGSNSDPVAGFNGGPCTVGVPCLFTDASTDPDGPTTIVTRSWDFNGDGTEDLGGNQTNPSFTYQTAGTPQAKLTVTDDAGNTDDATLAVTVNPGTTNNAPPVASFDLPTCTAGTPCGFHSTSTDADGTIAPEATAWDFGDGQTGTGIDVTHTYQAAAPVTVTLSVTDDKGATATTNQQLTVQPAVASQNCATSGTTVDCDLTMTAQATVKFAMVSASCDFSGNALAVVPPTVPSRQNIFLNICARAPGEEKILSDPADPTGVTALKVPAGAIVRVRFFQAQPDPTDPEAGDPGIKIQGQYPNWTLQIDDGGNIHGLGEPDFNDAVVSVTATPAP